MGYIDDLVLWNSSSSELQFQSVRTMSVLERLGLTVNLVKSCPSPVSSLAWLGIVWDSRKGTWCPNPPILEKIASRALTLSLAQRSARQQREALCCLIAFAAQVNRRAYHYMHHSANLALFNHAVDRDQKVKVHPLLLASLKPWLRVQDWLKPEKFFTSQSSVQCWTDASLGGWGEECENQDAEFDSYSSEGTESDADMYVEDFEGF